jgi:pimeloyl-ACP methyl ester carboxylesterase
LSQDEFDEEFASYRASFPEATCEFVRALFASSADPVLVERIAADMSEAPPEIGLSAAREATGHDLAQALEEVQAPIRCISSDGGTVDIEAAQRHASSFEVVYMGGVGHFVMLEDHETFNRLLAETVGEPTRLSAR